MEFEEIEKRMKEIKSEVPNADNEKFEELEAEFRSLEKKRKILKIENEVKSDGVDVIEKRSKVDDKNKRYTAEDDIYKRAWAKSLMMQKLDNEERKAINDVNYRSMGSAITNTSETFNAPTVDIDGVNNGGLFIPTTVMYDLLGTENIESPVLRDVAKLKITGTISFPYEKSSTDAKWYEEDEETEDMSIEWAEFTLTGRELSKSIRITWKLEKMTPNSFVNYILSELKKKMTPALIKSVIYGSGNNEPNGISNTTLQYNYDADDNLIEHIANSFLKLPKTERAGAKAYVSDEIYTKLTLQKDGAGNYVYRHDGNGSVKIAGRYRVEAEPYLLADDFIVGNLSNYKLNENESVTIVKDIHGKSRINDYTAHAIYDGNFVPDTIVFGTLNEA